MSKLKDFVQSEKALIRDESKMLGTVRENMTDFYGKDGKLTAVSAKNVADPDKMLMLKIHDGKGEQVVLYCSKPIGAMLRTKELSMPQVLDLRLVWHTVGEQFASAGAEYPLVISPDVEISDDMNVTAKDTADAYEREPVNLAEMLAFS